MENEQDNLLKPAILPIEDPLTKVRERTLHLVLMVAAFLSTVYFGWRVYEAVRLQSYVGFFQNILWYIGILAIAFIPRIHFRIRAIVGMIYLYALGLYFTLLIGPQGITLAWFFCLPIFSVIYINFQVGIWTIVLSTVTLMVIGVGIDQLWIPTSLMRGALSTRSLSYWLYSTLSYFVIGMISIYIINAIIKGLNQKLTYSDKQIQELEKERNNYIITNQALEHREDQLRKAAQISRNMSSHLDPNLLFDQVVDIIKEQFNLYYIGVFILDPYEQFALLHSGSGEAGKSMVEAGYKIPIDDKSLIGWTISHQQARIIPDIGQTPFQFDNSYLPQTRSELGIPMIKSNRIIGAITLQSDKTNAFDENDVIALRGVADSLAIAYENAILFQKTEESLAEIERLNQLYLTESWSTILGSKGDLEYSYENQTDKGIPAAFPMKIEKPIILRDQIIGSIVLETDDQLWDSEDETFLEAIATQASLALENVRLTEVTQMSARHNRVVAELSNKVWASTDIDTILQTTLTELTNTLNASKGLIQLEISNQNEKTEIDESVIT